MEFSIIVPVYNVENYLRKCVESLLNQKFDSYEIILVNDGSTDNSFVICEEYEKNKKVTVINKDNGGLSDARNHGIRAALGKYILFVDSDDYVEKNALCQIHDIIIQNNNPDVIYTRYKMHEAGQIIIGRNYYSEPNVLQSGYEMMRKELQHRNLPIAACFGIYKRSILLNYGLYFTVGILHEDERWSPQVLINAEKVFTSNLCYYNYVRQQGSITKKIDKSKNGLDLLDTCNFFLNNPIVQNDIYLERLFNNKIAMNYMKAVSIGKLYRKEYKTNVNRVIPIRYAYFAKDRLKAIIFLINLKLYCWISNKTDI